MEYLLLESGAFMGRSQSFYVNLPQARFVACVVNFAALLMVLNMAYLEHCSAVIILPQNATHFCVINSNTRIHGID
jgi:hypothetical protein